MLHEDAEAFIQFLKKLFFRPPITLAGVIIQAVNVQNDVLV
jgi:hypothetical protein